MTERRHSGWLAVVLWCCLLASTPAAAQDSQSASSEAPELDVEQILTPAAQQDALQDITIGDPAAAFAYYETRPQIDPNGDTVLLYLVGRYYGAENMQNYVDLLTAFKQGLRGALKPVSLTCTLAHVLFHNSTGPDSQPRPAAVKAAASDLGTPLSRYMAMDVYFAIVLPKGMPLSIPLTAGASVVSSVVNNYVKQIFQQAGLQSAAANQMLIDYSFSKDFRNPARVYHDQNMEMVMDVVGDGAASLDAIEKQTLLLQGLTMALVNSTSTIRAVNLTVGSEAVPGPFRRLQSSRRLLQGSSGATPTRIAISMRVQPIDQIIPSDLFRQRLKGALFGDISSELGLPVTLRYVSGRLRTRLIPPTGTIETRITDDALSGFLGNLAEAVTPAAESDVNSRVGAGTAAGQAADAAAAAATAASGGSGRISGGAIAGIAIGVAAVLALAAAAAFLLVRRHTRVAAASSGSNSDGGSGSKWSGVSSSAAGSPTGSVLDKLGVPSSIVDGRRHDSTTSVPLEQRTPSPGTTATNSMDGSSLLSHASSSRQSFGVFRSLRRLSTKGRGRRRASSASSAEMALASEIAVEIDAADIELCRDTDGQPLLLGRGSFGHVYKAMRFGMQEVAVKTIDKAAHDDSFLTLLRREIRILQTVSFDRNIVQYYGACLSNPQAAMLVMEYMPGRDLRHALNLDSAGRLRWRAGGRGIALDIARGLQFLHSSHVIHRDLKSSNVLLTSDGVAKIGDVGLAKLAENGDESSLHIAGTFAYAAPELLLGLRCTTAADIFSFGVLLWELVTHEQPRRGQLRDLRVPEEGPAELQALIDSCLVVDPAQRLSAQQIFQRMQAIADEAPAASDSGSPNSSAADGGNTCSRQDGGGEAYVFGHGGAGADAGALRSKSSDVDGDRAGGGGRLGSGYVGRTVRSFEAAVVSPRQGRRTSYAIYGGGGGIGADADGGELTAVSFRTASGSLLSGDGGGGSGGGGGSSLEAFHGTDCGDGSLPPQHLHHNCLPPQPPPSGGSAVGGRLTAADGHADGSGGGGSRGAPSKPSSLTDGGSFTRQHSSGASSSRSFGHPFLSESESCGQAYNPHPFRDQRGDVAAAAVAAPTTGAQQAAASAGNLESGCVRQTAGSGSSDVRQWRPHPFGDASSA